MAPGDLARWAFWVHGRRVLPVDHPRLLRSARPLWRATYAGAGARRALLADELLRCFGPVAADRVGDAYRVAFRVHFEELLIGKLSSNNWQPYLRFEGREHLDAALARGRGAIVLFPHAGNFMLMIAALALSGYSYTQFAARGLAPEEVARENPGTFGHNRWRKEARRAREASEDRLPATFLTMDTGLRELYRRLARNEVVGIAFDGRVGHRWQPVPFLGRQALLNPGAYRLAASTGAAIVPALCACPAEGPDVCTLGEPIWPDGRRPDALLEAYVHGVAEPWLRAHPAEYGTWLLHCRMRPGVDDHPLFTDYAPDDRWTRWRR